MLLKLPQHPRTLMFHLVPTRRGDPFLIEQVRVFQAGLTLHSQAVIFLIDTPRVMVIGEIVEIRVCLILEGWIVLALDQVTGLVIELGTDLVITLVVTDERLT